MEIILDYILEIIAGVSITVISGFLLWLFGEKIFNFNKKPKPISQKTIIKGDNNTVNNSNEQNESHDSHAVALGQGNIAIGKAQNVSIKQANSNVQMPPEELKRRIELERNDAVEEYKKANTDSEKEEPLRKITEFDKRLSDLPKSLREELRLIGLLKSLLSSESDKIDTPRLTEAMIGLENDDFSKADALFAEIEERGGLTAQRASSLALSRGYIAERAVNWGDAAEHYARSAKKYPHYNSLIKAEAFASLMGDYDSALSLGLELKKITIAEYGEGSAQHVSTLNNLGSVYKAQERYDEAGKLYLQALKICKERLEDEHPYTAETINNIGGIYQLQAEYEKAESLFNESLIIKKKILGESHPDIAHTINNLASIYFSQGLYEKAELFYKKALKIRQDALGESHPSIAANLNNLAALYRMQGEYKKAKPLCKQAIEIFENAFGSDHPNTKLFKSNYAELKRDIANT